MIPTSYVPGQVVELTTVEVAHGGWCVARPADGPVVFVRHALPGERVLARVTEVTSRLARAEAVEILTPSPDRVIPPCPQARPGGCGGCDWQHAALPAAPPGRPAARRWRRPSVRARTLRSWAERAEKSFLGPAGSSPFLVT